MEDGVMESRFVLCPAATHAAAKTSLAAFAVACAGRLHVWSDRPAPGWLLVSGNCSCKTTLGLHVTDAQWEAFAGEPVPAHVEVTP